MGRGTNSPERTPPQFPLDGGCRRVHLPTVRADVDCCANTSADYGPGRLWCGAPLEVYGHELTPKIKMQNVAR